MIVDKKYKFCLNFLQNLGCDNLLHGKGDSQKPFSKHLLNTALLLKEYGRPLDEQLAGMCHSIYGTEFYNPEFSIPINRKSVIKIIGNKAENLVYIFCNTPNRDQTILDGFKFKEPIKTQLRWISYCNIYEQCPDHDLIVKFRFVLNIL